MVPEKVTAPAGFRTAAGATAPEMNVAVNVA
jgi:hypothetical protein